MPSDIESRSSAPTIEQRISDIEGKMASSWALKARSEYESELRGQIKSELLIYVTKLALSALVVLAGAGYVVLKSAIVDVYQAQNQQVVADLKARYDENLREEQSRFEWKKQHDYGKNYVYLAAFYWNSRMSDKKKMHELIADHLKRAATYFSLAIRADPKQATSYWEMGELFYTYAKEYGEPDRVDLDQALHYYREAARLYSDIDIAKGWRADTYRALGKLYLEKAASAGKPDEAKSLQATASQFLEKAQDEYIHVIPESREYNDKRLKEVRDLLVTVSRVSNGRLRQ